MKTVVPARQIVLAYLLLSSAGAALWFTALEPAWEGYVERRGSIEAGQLRLQRLEIAAANDPALDAASSKAMTDTLLAYLDRSSLGARTADIGGSELRQRLLHIVQQNGGKPGDTRISDGPGPSMVTVSMNLSIDLPGLRDVLYEMEAARPFIFVDVLSIRNPQRLAAAATDGPPELAVQVNASSYWLPAMADGGGS